MVLVGEDWKKLLENMSQQLKVENFISMNGELIQSSEVGWFTA